MLGAIHIESGGNSMYKVLSNDLLWLEKIFVTLFTPVSPTHMDTKLHGCRKIDLYTQ
jgi:hypothetical protein